MRKIQAFDSAGNEIVVGASAAILVRRDGDLGWVVMAIAENMVQLQRSGAARRVVTTVSPDEIVVVTSRTII